VSYKLLSFRSADGSAIAGALLRDRVYRIADLPGLQHARTMLDVLADWPRNRDLLDRASRSTDMPSAHAARPQDVELLAPVPNPGAVYCSGGNYSDHVDEMRALLKHLPPDIQTSQILGEMPWHFLKTSRGSVVGPGSSVSRPIGARQLDWEVELVAVIGTPAKRVSVESALQHVAGYTIGNDLSARDRSTRHEIHAGVPFRFDWLAHKCFEGSFPCGPWIAPAAEIPDPQALGLKLWVNDELMQDSNSSRMIFNVAQQISQLSRNLTLFPGDLIATGTPAGVGSGRGRFLARGDTVRMAIERIGEFSHTIAD
jgi:2-keto-4-pentenoate hydratase/2-oxohepta-3-ene-1,7-dioic acid hydratase in catechol pathway